MSEIKYEAVFGPQELFNNEFEPNAIAVIFIDRTSKLHATSEAEIDRQLQCTGSYVVAMRRIIKTPVWTVADQKAGRLPEVSCRVDFSHKLNTKWRTGEIKYVDNQVVVIKADDIDRPFVYEFDRVEFKPIETPAEKAARLKSEWCAKAAKQLKNLEYTSTLTSIYDALLSGELKAPGVE